MTRLEGAAARAITAWTRLYTAGLPAQIRDRRRAEIGSDVHGQLAEARVRQDRAALTAARMLGRAARGSWHDLTWRHEAGGPYRALRWRARRPWWLAAALAITFLAGIVSVAYGTTLRTGADRVPMRLAASAAGKLASSARPGGVLPPAIDLTASRAPFVIVFDSAHHVLASSGRLGGRIPSLPGGVLAWAAAHGQDHVTWQPRPGLREAAIIEPFGGGHPGFVLAAQSLQAVTGQQREFLLAAAGSWLGALAVTVLVLRQLPFIARRRQWHTRNSR